MKRRTLLKGAAVGLALASGPALAQDESYTIGVAIPSATHKALDHGRQVSK